MEALVCKEIILSSLTSSYKSTLLLVAGWHRCCKSSGTSTYLLKGRSLNKVAETLRWDLEFDEEILLLCNGLL